MYESLKMDLENVQKNYQIEKTVSDNLKAEIHELKNLQASNECVISDLTDRNSLLTQNIETLKSELSISIKKSAKLEEEITYYKTELSSLNSHILSDEKTIEELRLIDKEYNIFLESHKNCEDIKAKLEFLNEMHAKLELDNKSLRSENDALTEEQHRLRKTVKNWENLEKELKNKNDEIKSDFESKLAIVKQDMVSSLEKKDALLQDLTSECELLRKQFEISEALQADLKNLQQNYQHEKAISGSLRAEIHEFENLHSSNLSIISELGERNCTLTQNLEAMKSELSGSNKKIEELEEAIAGYETELINLNAKLLSNEKRIEELVVIDKEYNALLESHKKCDEIKVKLISLNEIHAQLRHDYEFVRNENKVLKQNQHNQHEEYIEEAADWANLEKELKNKINEMNVDFENQLMLLKQEMVSSLEKKNGLLQDLSFECESLRKQLEMSEVLKAELENAYQSYQIEKKNSINLKAEVHELKNLQATNECIISELTDRNSLLTRNTETLKTEVCVSNKKLAELGEEITNYKIEFYNLSDQISSNKITIEELRLIEREFNIFLESHKDCEEIKAKLEFLNEMHAKLNLDNDSLRSENGILKQDQVRLHKNFVEANNELKIDFENQLALLKQEMVEKTVSANLKAEVLEQKNLQASKECIISELNEKNSLLTQKIENINSELSASNKKLAEVEKEISNYKSELSNLSAQILSDKKTIEELRLIEKEYNIFLESHKNCEDVHSTLKLDILRCENEIQKQDQLRLHKESAEANNELKIDFENQIALLEQEMKALNDEMEKKNDEFKEKLRQYTEKISKDEAQIAELNSQLWETSDKLLLTQNGYLKLKSKLQNIVFVNVQSPSDSHVDNRRRSLSVGSIPLLYQHTNPTIIEHSDVQPMPGSRSDSHVTEGTDDTIQMRRHGFPLAGMGKKFTLPLGKVVPSENVTEELFDNRNVVDLKEIRCNVPDDFERLSTSMLHNSLCPSNLKSSYPAETQFLLPMGSKEEDIKASTSRSSHTQDSVLQKLNINKSQKQPTPGRFRSLFSATHSSKRGENTPKNNSASSKNNSLTPRRRRRRRLSFFHKHFGNCDRNDNAC
ncbi:uncharacterized protein LOC142318165 [Lycorma delicatula]|uniref:uncharacterized protein LOC142318165 n=1 Tax=Lycorma delicatula TaxID=130591 RepID=UPI003F50DE96